MTRELKIMTPEHVELSFELAGLGSRFIAMLLDTLLITLAYAIIGLLAFLAVLLLEYLGMQTALDMLSPWVVAAIVLLLFLLSGGYFLFFESTRNGQTLGKKAVGIRVIRDSGHPVDFRSAVLRNVIRIVDFLPLAYAVGFISIFLSPQYRRVGDVVAGTLVVKVNPKATITTSARISNMTSRADKPDDAVTEPDTLPGEGLLPQEAMPNLRSLDRDDYRAIRHFLDRRRELPQHIAFAMAQKLAEPLARKLQMDPKDIQDPCTFLEAVGLEWEKRMVH